MEDEDWYIARASVLNRLLIAANEITILSWRPNNSEIYYVPDVTADKKYSSWRWFNNETDQLHYQRGVIFKTAEEAIAAAEQMLVAVQEVRNDG